jgi:ABC-type phosphonate transport system ATPase subunit
MLRGFVHATDSGVRIATHDIAGLWLRADRLMVMQDGCMMDHGPTHQVPDDPPHGDTRPLARPDMQM